MTVAVWQWLKGLSLLASRPKDRAGSVELSGGGKDDVPWETVYVAANRMEADIVRAHLEAEDIPAVVRGEAVGGVYGLTTGPMAQVEILVPAPLAERARTIVHAEDTHEEAYETDHV